MRSPCRPRREVTKVPAQTRPRSAADSSSPLVVPSHPPRRCACSPAGAAAAMQARRLWHHRHRPMLAACRSRRRERQSQLLVRWRMLADLRPAHCCWLAVPDARALPKATPRPSRSLALAKQPSHTICSTIAPAQAQLSTVSQLRAALPSHLGSAPVQRRPRPRCGCSPGMWYVVAHTL